MTPDARNIKKQSIICLEVGSLNPTFLHIMPVLFLHLCISSWFIIRYIFMYEMYFNPVASKIISRTCSILLFNVTTSFIIICQNYRTLYSYDEHKKKNKTVKYLSYHLGFYFSTIYCFLALLILKDLFLWASGYNHMNDESCPRCAKREPKTVSDFY